MADVPTVRCALLLGPDHEEMGAVAVSEVGSHVALGISRGRFLKAYPHVDPNEDAGLAVTDGSRHLLAVLDGHSGFDAAGAAAESLRSGGVDLIASGAPRHAGDAGELLVELAADARDAGAAAAEQAAGPRQGSATTLTMCLAGPDGAAVLSFGDSVAVLAGRRGRVLTRPAAFLSAGVDLTAGYRRDVRLRPGDRLALVTDGVSDFLGRRWEQRAAVELRAAPTPGDAARGLIAAAFDGGAGDNLAAAVLFAD